MVVITGRREHAVVEEEIRRVFSASERGCVKNVKKW